MRRARHFIMHLRRAGERTARPLNTALAVRVKRIAMDQKELTALFRRLGASNPDEWAHSEITEGIPQLARCVFLR